VECERRPEMPEWLIILIAVLAVLLAIYLIRRL
jgi:hypothetical protein